MATISLFVTTIGSKHNASIPISCDACIFDLRSKIKQKLRLGANPFWLVAGDRRLADNASVALSGLSDGAVVNVILVAFVKDLFSSSRGFAALMSTEAVVSWGDNGCQSDLEALSAGVYKVYSNMSGFAALKTDRSVVSWGLDKKGCDSWDIIASQLQGSVKKIYSTGCVFAALKTDGSVVKWCGDSGRASTAKLPLHGVARLTSVDRGFVVSYVDGASVFWHLGLSGSDALKEEATRHGLPTQVVCTCTNQALISGSVTHIGMRMADGSAVILHEVAPHGVPEAPVVEKLSGVKQLCQSRTAIVALKEDGSTIGWHLSAPGILCATPALADELQSGCFRMFSTSESFAVLKNNGSVFTFSRDTFYSPACVIKPGSSKKVREIYTNAAAFAALKTDGSVICWGDARCGGDITEVTAELSKGVSIIVPSNCAFAALKTNGSVISWGQEMSGYRKLLREKLQAGVVQIVASKSAFAARKVDGQVWTWGSDDQGGNSEEVASFIRPFEEHDVEISKLQDLHVEDKLKLLEEFCCQQLAGLRSKKFEVWPPVGGPSVHAVTECIREVLFEQVMAYVEMHPSLSRDAQLRTRIKEIVNKIVGITLDSWKDLDKSSMMCKQQQ